MNNKKAGRRGRRVSSLILQKEVEITQHQMDYLRRESHSSEENSHDQHSESSNHSSDDANVENIKRKTNMANKHDLEELGDIEEVNESPMNSPRHKKTKPKTSLSDGK